jgi:hypothetical protein
MNGMIFHMGLVEVEAVQDILDLLGQMELLARLVRPVLVALLVQQGQPVLTL